MVGVTLTRLLLLYLTSADYEGIDRDHPLRSAVEAYRGFNDRTYGVVVLAIPACTVLAGAAPFIGDRLLRGAAIIVLFTLLAAIATIVAHGARLRNRAGQP